MPHLVRLRDDLTAVRSAASSYGESLQSASKPTETLFQAVKSLNREVPGLHQVMTAISHPIGVAAVAIGALVKGLIEAERAAREAAKQVQDMILQANRVAQPVATAARATREAAQFNAELAEKLKAVAEESGKAATNLTAMGDELRRQQQLADEQEDADMAIALAKAGDDPEKRAGIRAQFGATRLQRRQAALGQQGQAQIARARELELELGNVGLAIPAAEREMEAARSGKLSEEARLEQRNIVRSQQRADLEKDILNADAIISDPTWRWDFAPERYGGIEFEGAFSRVEKAQRIRTAARQGISRLAAAEEQDKGRVSAAGRRFATAGQKLTALKTAEVTLPGQIAGANQAASDLQSESQFLGTSEQIRVGREAGLARIEGESRRLADEAKRREQQDRETIALIRQILGHNAWAEEQIKSLQSKLNSLQGR